MISSLITQEVLDEIILYSVLKSSRGKLQEFFLEEIALTLCIYLIHTKNSEHDTKYIRLQTYLQM